MIGRRARHLWVLGTVCLLWAPAFGADRIGGGASRPSREDARDLATLAPPSRRSTAAATYGDAPFAPRHPHRRFVTPAQEGADAPVGLYVCPGQDRRTIAPHLCARDPRRVGFRQFYVYTPVYATSPQVPRDGLGRETPLLPPATRFFYSANSFLFGNPAED